MKADGNNVGKVQLGNSFSVREERRTVPSHNKFGQNIASPASKGVPSTESRKFKRKRQNHNVDDRDHPKGISEVKVSSSRLGLHHHDIYCMLE